MKRMVNERLDERAAAARAEGMSYGKYIARHFPTSPAKSCAIVRPVKCAHCGTVFEGRGRKRYCSEQCRVEAWANMRKAGRYL